jgi:hypothetical protein
MLVGRQVGSADGAKHDAIAERRGLSANESGDTPLSTLQIAG